MAEVTRPEVPKIETRRAVSGWGFWGGAASFFTTSYRAWGVL